MAQCTLYNNTGFTPINLPYDYASLTAAAESVTEAVTLDLIQIYGLSEISVKQFEDGVMDCDYVVITNNGNKACYAVTGYKMTSMDVARLYLAADPGLTAGGWDKINIVSGTWTRSPKNNQNKMIVDGMLQISDMTKVGYDYVGSDTVDTDQYDFQFVASTVKLENVPDETDKVAYTYDDEEGTVSYAYVPQPVTEYTKIIIEVPGDLTDSAPVTLTALTTGYAIYDFSNDRVKKAVANLRAYGYESAIMGAWRVPSSFVKSKIAGTMVYDTGKYIQIATKSIVGSLTRPGFNDPATLYSDALYQTTENIADIIEHAESFRVGLMSVATGAKIEKRLSEITGKIYCIADPRMNGCPYYIMQDMPYNPPGSSEDILFKRAYISGELQRCSVQGATWDAVPIIYEGASGRVQNYMKLKQSQDYAAENYGANMDYIALSGMAGMMSSLPGVNISLPQSWSEGDLDTGFMDYGSSQGSFSLGKPNAGRAAGSLLASYVAADKLTRARIQDAKTSMAEYVISNKLVVPEVTSQTIEGIQQYIGNGAIMYATYPTETDVLRFGTIAAAFGLACYRPADSSIDKPAAACYYSGSGIEVVTSTKVPNSVRKDISELLNIGVRLWSVKPRRLTASDWENSIGGNG